MTAEPESVNSHLLTDVVAYKRLKSTKKQVGIFIKLYMCNLSSLVNSNMELIFRN